MSMNHIEELINRNKAFVEMKEVDRPMIGVSLIGSNVPLEQYKRTAMALPSSGLIRPEMLTTKHFLKCWMQDVEELFLQHEKVGGDILWPAIPFYGIPWMEAIIGCPIYISSHTFWAAPFIHDWNQLGKINSVLEGLKENKWFKTILELKETLITWAKGKYPVSTSTLMRGPGDMASAAMGQTQLLLELYDNLEKVKNLCSICTKVWIEVAKAQIELNSEFHEGHVVGIWGIWTHEVCQYIQDDALAYFSPKFYREVLLSNHLDMSNKFKCSFFHLHPTNLYAVDELVKMKDITIIEVAREFTPPSVKELLPVLRKIQKYKPLEFCWGYEAAHGTTQESLIQEEIELLLENLSPKGLCILFVPRDEEEGRRLIKLTKKILKTKV